MVEGWGEEQAKQQQIQQRQDEADLQTSASMNEDSFNSDDANLKKWIAAPDDNHPTAYDKYSSKDIRLSNLDAKSNKKMRFEYTVLFLCHDLGRRASKAKEFSWSLLKRWSDIYAATGEGRERKMLTTTRAELVRENRDAPQNKGILSSLQNIR